MSKFSYRRAWIIASTDLRQLRSSRDFWLPLGIIAALFFVVMPAALFAGLSTIKDAGIVTQIGNLMGSLPKSIQHQTAGRAPNVQAAYALAVYLFAPLAIIVPLTVSSAVGSQTIIGERERGSGEFLAHSPASEREIFIGKLVASLLPGYLTAGVGFLLYSLIVNLIVGPQVGGWFFPTTNWWILVLWVVPPFLALVVGIILRISSRVSSAAAAQQASALVTLPLVILAYALATGSLSRAKLFGGGLGLVAWMGAVIVLASGARSLRRERLLGLGA
ncbi:MAG TPA: ABC transporter permease [Acidimicrobiia bacterium]|jgi:ABC-type Na+ efflux pump permease subunit|nr:ABC transporter permease [Acidimicrobiia bacterium]